MKHLVLGGVKSGKSKFAEDVAEAALLQGSTDHVVLVATAQALDEEMARRIERHKLDRPKSWLVVEEPIYLARAISEIDSGVVVVDCLTLWLTNLLMLEDRLRLEEEVEELVAAVKGFEGTIILVSNETNMGVMPMGELSRLYCDTAGALHKQLAEVCDKVDLIVAGLPLELKPSVRCTCK